MAFADFLEDLDSEKVKIINDQLIVKANEDDVAVILKRIAKGKMRLIQDDQESENFLGSKDLLYFIEKYISKSEERNLNLKPIANLAMEEVSATKKSELEIIEDKLNDLYDKQFKRIYSDFPEFYDVVMQLLLSNMKDEEIQSELLDILGEAAIEFIFDVIPKRKHLISQFNKKKKNDTVMTKTSVISLGQNVRVNLKTKSESQELSPYAVLNPEKLRKAREDSLKQERPLFSSNTKLYSSVNEYAKYPHVYGKPMSSTGLSEFGTKIALPVDTKHLNIPEYEEFSIPFSSSATYKQPIDLVPISFFREFAQKAFPSYKSLNRMQSLIFDTAYNSNENVLVAAPTGAGKTDVAMMCILKCLENNISPSGRLENSFKIVYVAPMKALAAEITLKLAKRLRYANIHVREWTGDMQLSKAEVINTHIVVTTPEKYDVITRKSTGDDEFFHKVQLLIIDEVHLLHDDRGPVLESIIARTLREVEISQRLIRLVGLSATLPNFMDVARLLRVNLEVGMYFFDGSFRPVPLEQNFIGVKGTSHVAVNSSMIRITFERCLEELKQGYQVMVFVHSRGDTFNTAKKMIELMREFDNSSAFFSCEKEPSYGEYSSIIAKSKNRQLSELFANGISIHHAESMFADKCVKVLVCTATLAWGVNLPAHAVIIKGTQIFNPEKGGFVDLGILDVLQIFGRAGRPQFEENGVGTIITTHDKLQHYVSSMTMQKSIESRFVEHLIDNLNAEICLGSVASITDAIQWLSYTFLYIRMTRNPRHYGITDDMDSKLLEIVTNAAKELKYVGMAGYDPESGLLRIKELGRIAALYYLSYQTMDIFRKKLKNGMVELDIMDLMAEANEFTNLKVRDDEIKELTSLRPQGFGFDKEPVNSIKEKVSILLQSYIQSRKLEVFSLVSDMNYVAQNSGRILRALFEMSVNYFNYAETSCVILNLCKSVEKKMWFYEHPLRQFDLKWLTFEVLDKISDYEIEDLRLMSPSEILDVVKIKKVVAPLHKLINQFPFLEVDTVVQPISKNAVKLAMSIKSLFLWSESVHGTSEPFYLFVQNTFGDNLYFKEYFILNKQKLDDPYVIDAVIPLETPMPSQLLVKVISDKWLGCDFLFTVMLPDEQAMPSDQPYYTDLLPLDPLPITALNDALLEDLYSKKFLFFNPIQTQVFHNLYHGSNHVLIGSPTGSGKTIMSELAIFNAFRNYPKSKIIYIAPLKALVKERFNDWKESFQGVLNKSVVELTGDTSQSKSALENASIIITTPEKWDGITRMWKLREFVQNVSLVIIDEIHLLGTERGPSLEMIVSRMSCMSSTLKKYPLRFVGLSTALANAQDIGNWLTIPSRGLFNFRPFVRPIPLEVHIDGFSGKHYCPRMASMNKPCYNAILSHSESKPVLIFVSSRRQTRLTAQGIISYMNMELNQGIGGNFLLNHPDIDSLVKLVQDEHLKHSLRFGIGLHHAGLVESDRKIVEELFVHEQIRLLIATSTVAWGLNFPCHLVIVKGTEYYDAKTKTYIDYPITDILQMMGRAGRPQYDNSGKAFIFVSESKKEYYKKFLYEPFPVESSLHKQLNNHINADISSKMINSLSEAVGFLSWTFLHQRMQKNPHYYMLDNLNIKENELNLMKRTIKELEASDCLKISKYVSDTEWLLESTKFGSITSQYYIDHKTTKIFKDALSILPIEQTVNSIILLLSQSTEFDEFPIRHNEDRMLKDIEEKMRIAVIEGHESPHTKVLYVYQLYLSHLPWPITDFETDCKLLLDQSIRLLQAMIDVAAEYGNSKGISSCVRVMQCLKQRQWPEYSSLAMLFSDSDIRQLNLRYQITDISRWIETNAKDQAFILKNCQITPEKVMALTKKMPKIKLEFDRVNEFTFDFKVKYLEPISLPVHTPHFKSESDILSWFFIISNDSINKVCLFKRLTLSTEPTKFKFTFTKTQAVKNVYSISLMNDSYIGVDQAYTLEF